MTSFPRPSSPSMARCAVFCLLTSVGLTSLAVVPGALAQGAVLPLAEGPAAFREMLLDTAPSAMRGALVGVSIVGVRIDAPAREFDPKAVRVMLGDGDNGRDFLCVRYISRDGRYSAQARYKLSAGMNPSCGRPEQPMARNSKAMVSTTWRSWPSATTCDKPKEGSLFAVVPSEAAGAELVVMIAGEDARVRAQLGQNNKAVTAAVVCSPAAVVRVGFTQECRIPLPPTLVSGKYQISIGETATTGEISVKTHPLVLYRPARPK